MYGNYEELGSIVKFFYENHDKKDIVKLYFEEVKKGFEEPSVYFPMPTIISDNYTTHSFQNSYTWFIKLFDNSTLECQNSAMQLCDRLCKNRYLIPVYTKDNKKTDRYVKINNVDIKKIEEGVIEIDINFNLAYFFKIQDYVKFAKFNLDDNLKEG